MPILAAESSEYPEDLFDTATLDEERRWWALYTKPRQEKSLARDLVRMKLRFYLPVVKKLHRIRGREVKAELPLFDGYIFLHAQNDERVRSLTTQRIAQIVPVIDQQRLHNDLCRLRGLIATDAPLTIERKILPGRRVRICAGVMKGLEGTVLLRRGQTRLVVAVDFMQQGASVAIEDYLLEPLD
jgi:transcription antitermination factor NusG